MVGESKWGWGGEAGGVDGRGGGGGGERELLPLYFVSIYSFCLLPSGADLVAHVRAAISLCICREHEGPMVPLFKGTGRLKVWFV